MAPTFGSICHSLVDVPDEKWEIMKPIEFKDATVEISNIGRIRTISDKIVVDSVVSDNGYSYFYIVLNGTRKMLAVHRAVAFAFLPSPPHAKYVVEHINGDKVDNHAQNLRWVSTQENCSRFH